MAHTPYCYGKAVPLLLLPNPAEYESQACSAKEDTSFPLRLQRGEVMWLTATSTAEGSECAILVTLVLTSGASMVLPLTVREPLQIVMPHDVARIDVQPTHEARVAMWRAERAAPSDLLPLNSGGIR